MSYPLARWERPLTETPALAEILPTDATAGEVGTPIEAVHAVCQRLADLAAEAEDRPRRQVPRLRPHGLADQLTVLTRDALAAAPDRATIVARLLVALRRTL